MSRQGNITQHENSQKAKLFQAVQRVEHDRKICYHEEVVKRSLDAKEHYLMGKVLDKLVPTQNEHSGTDGQPIVINITRNKK